MKREFPKNPQIILKNLVGADKNRNSWATVNIHIFVLVIFLPLSLFYLTLGTLNLRTHKQYI